MTSLSDNQIPDARSLRTYLETVVPDAHLSDAEVNSAYPRVLLFQTKHFLAAFAFSNGDVRKSYDVLYGGFKSHFVSQPGKWDAFDLAFVFCVRPGVPNLDRFCATVETDVYFCRKFVVPLTMPLAHSLASLPFLPLTPIHGTSLRPASAETFLQQCGVPAELAKCVVVQYERKPETIIEDCISGGFGEPRSLTRQKDRPIVHSQRRFEPVTLDTVTIENFRAYRSPQTFAIGADVTVLYGPNGFGKTSFFDAIDFAATAEIGRIKSSNDAEFAKVARHLDCGSEDSVVSIRFRSNGAVRELRRSVKDRKKALLDGRPTERKPILAELTGDHVDARERVDHLVSLFRATHLFSQERAELTKDFGNDCRLSAEIVSRMLALEDYTNALNKATRVRNLLRTTIATAKSEMNDLAGHIQKENAELERLGASAKPHINVESLGAEFEALRRKLVAVGLRAEPQKADLATVRGWRASLESRQAESQSRSNRLSGLLGDVAQLEGARAALSSVREEIAQKEQDLRTVEEERVSIEAEVDRAERQIAELKDRRTKAEGRAAALELVRRWKPEYVQLVERRDTVNDELIRAEETLAKYSANRQKAAHDRDAAASRVSSAAERLDAKHSEEEDWSSLLKRACARRSEITDLITKKQQLDDDLTRAADALAKDRGDELKAGGEVRTLEDRALELAQQVQAERSALSSVQNLSAAAVSWRSNRNRLVTLAESMHESTRTQESLRTEEQRLLPELDTLAAEEARLARHVSKIEEGHSELNALLTQLQSHVRTSVCPLCGVDHGSTEELTRRIQKNMAIDAASDAREDLVSIRRKVRDLAERIGVHRRQQESQITKHAKLREEQTRLSAEVGEFVRSAAEVGVVVEEVGASPAEQLEIRQKQHQRTIKELNEQIRKASIQVGAARETLTNAKNRVTVSEAGVTQRKTEAARLEGEIGRLRNDARTEQLSLDTDLDQLASVKRLRFEEETEEFKKQIQEARAEIETARKTVADIDDLVANKALETDRLTAELVSLEQGISQLENDPRLTDIALETDDERLAEMMRLNLDQLTELKSEAPNAETRLLQKKTEMSALRHESSALRSQVEKLRARLMRLQETVAQIIARLQESNLPDDASEETVLTLIADESRLQAQLLALRDSSASLELGIDAATTAAALTRLRESVRDKENAIATAKGKRYKGQPWLKYFEQVVDLAASQRDEATSNFTREYGPRTSVIQRRLRSVYGFEDLEIRSDESNISVRVMRHGEELRPTDYFSQSQQQTLLLSLYLTASISQTWSTFSPVLLDDPVTHFDDLNTYAFLDLIVGLLDSDTGKPQFIISTCDEKLLQLARQKFRHLGDRAKFFRFTAIGSEGPTVEEWF